MEVSGVRLSEIVGESLTVFELLEEASFETVRDAVPLVDFDCCIVVDNFVCVGDEDSVNVAGVDTLPDGVKLVSFERLA